MTITVCFAYKNHRGEVNNRTVDVDSIEFITTVHADDDYGYQPGWFLSGWDHTKQARRSFALCNIILDDLIRIGKDFRIELNQIKLGDNQ